MKVPKRELGKVKASGMEVCEDGLGACNLNIYLGLHGSSRYTAR